MTRDTKTQSIPKQTAGLIALVERQAKLIAELCAKLKRLRERGRR